MDVFSHGLWAGAAAKAVNLSPRTKNCRLCKKITEKPSNAGYKILSSVFARFWCGARKKKPLKVWLAMVWGIFPDVFAFAISFTYLNHFRITGGETPFAIRPGEMEPPVGQQSPILQLTHYLYDASHSLLVFFVVFSLIAWYFRRPVWEMGGWLLHILADIPTHPFDFFPTPFLWPLSNFMVDGTRWATKNFLLVNYSLIIIVYSLIWLIGRRRKRKS